MQNLSYTKSPTTLFSLAYGYIQPNGGNNGQITSITDNVDSTHSQAFTYDALSRLKEAQTANLTAPNTWKLVWTYDRYSNRPMQTQAGGMANALQPQLDLPPIFGPVITTLSPHFVRSLS